MPMGEKTILLWKNQTYRKHMIEAHKGQICPSRKGCDPWNKGLTKNTNNRVKRITEKLIGKKHIHRKKSYPKKSRKELWKNPDYVKKHKERMNKWIKDHPKETHERAIKGGLSSLESRRKNLPYKLFDVPFFSIGELECSKILLKAGILIEDKENCHVRIGNNVFDFLLFNTIFVEYHPTKNFVRETHTQYFERRKNILIDNGYEKFILMVLENPMGMVNILEWIGIEKLEALS